MRDRIVLTEEEFRRLRRGAKNAALICAPFWAWVFWLVTR